MNPHNPDLTNAVAAIVAGLDDRLQALTEPREPLQLLSVRHVAKTLAVSERCVREMVSTRELPSMTVSQGARRIERAELEAYIAARREAA